MNDSLLNDFDYLIFGFVKKTLPKEAWTHEAHLVTGLWHVANFGKDDALKKMRKGIKAYNESVGTINSETSGYHETITVFWVEVLEVFYKKYRTAENSKDFIVIAEEFLASNYVDKNLGFQFYTREKLLSTKARLTFIAPDLKDFSNL